MLKNNYFYYCWTSLLLLNIIGFILNADYTSSLFVNQLKGVLICSVVFYPFYYLSRIGFIKAHYFELYCFLIIPAFIFQFYKTKHLKQLLSIEYFTNNDGYLFLSLFPLTFLFNKKKWLSFLLIIIIGYFTIESAKRGAVIIYFVLIILFMLYLFNNELLSSNIGAIKKIFLVLFAIVILYGLYYFYQNNQYLLKRIEAISETGGSGRDVIYKGIYDYWVNSQNFITYLFGFGFAASFLVLGHWAHNDWFELLFDCGLLGFFIYFNLLISLLYVLFVQMKQKKEINYLLISIFISWFFTSLFSMWYSSAVSVTYSMLLGYLMGGFSKNDYDFQDC